MAPARLRIGWVAAETLHGGLPWFRFLEPAVAMRIRNVAVWMNENIPGVRNELYRPRRRYDVVVFFKAMDERCQEAAAQVRERGGRVVFDANVNYYEVWGDYDVPGTRPTERQQRDAIAMTTDSDQVVTDSSYLLGVVRRWNERATWIPDNVDLSVYGGERRHGPGGPVRLVWSGVAKKAQHLKLLTPVLARLDGFELVLVSDGRPAALEDLERALPCTFIRFSDRRYARVLRDCDVIISPKRLENGYELAHSEYKITLGMAAGLPAVASPQQSYVEAISDRGGGIVADGDEEWAAALESLRDPRRRAELGRRARETVRERYATPVVARAYADLLLGLA